MNAQLTETLNKKRVVVVVASTSYEGTVTHVIPGRQIVLSNVFSETLNKRIPKPLTVLAGEIESVRVLDPEQSSDDHIIKGKPLVKKHDAPTHLRKLDNTIDKDVLLNRVPVPAAQDDSGESTDQYLPPYFVIDAMNDQFRRAVREAMQESVIGLSMQGVRLGREGLICWIALAAGENVFLFDMCALGPPGIIHGLGDLFTHESIVKVVHDCRFVADALLHKYGVELCNVFDTQVADAVLLKRTQGHYSRFVNNLANCLDFHLGLPKERIFFRRVRASHMKEDESMWQDRPLPAHLEKAAVLQVCYLKQLRRVLMEKLLQEVTRGTELYLREVSSLPDSEALFKLDSAHLLPVSFASQVTTPVTPSRNNGEEAPRRYSKEECDPYLRFSRDIMHRTKS